MRSEACADRVCGHDRASHHVELVRRYDEHAPTQVTHEPVRTTCLCRGCECRLYVPPAA